MTGRWAAIWVVCLGWWGSANATTAMVTTYDLCIPPNSTVIPKDPDGSGNCPPGWLRGKKVSNSLTTTHAEASSTHDPRGFAALFDDGIGILLSRGGGKYQRVVAGLPEADEAQLALLDLDGDGVDDVVYVDAADPALLLFYGKGPWTKPDATVAIPGDVTLDAYEDVDYDVLTVKWDGGDAELGGVNASEAPEELP
ncbi:MAG: hypothetical protein ABMB14_23255 [Myxococcota bacterium]